MSICDKINTAGETLEANLTARGISCDFGKNSDGKDTIQDMAEMITASNLRGIGDAIIHISASRPYLLSGEKTDLIVTLHNGVGTPLANKSVTISDGTSLYSGITNNLGIFTLYDVEVSDTITMFTATYNTVTDVVLVYNCIFTDYGITSKHNENWVNNNSNITVTRNDMYTTLTPSVNSSQNRYDVPTVPNQPFVIEFDKHNTSMAGAYILIGNTTIQFSSSFSGNLASAKHLKFTIQDDKVTCEHDGVVEQTQLDITSLSYIRFQINNNNEGNVITFSNFRIYSID